MRKPLALCFSLLVLCAALTGCTLHQGSASAASQGRYRAHTEACSAKPVEASIHCSRSATCSAASTMPTASTRTA